MKASELKGWPVTLHPSEWPEGTLEHMDADLFTKIVWPARTISRVPMWPSAFASAHVRETGTSQHSTNNGTRLSTATDMHVKNHTNMMKLYHVLEANECVGGIGLYFDTNTPMVHMDSRSERIVWLRVDGQYIYKHIDPVKFYKELGKALEA